MAANGGRGVRHRVRHGIEVAQGKYVGSPAEHLWRRLDAMDFINRAMRFAATLFLCLFPFLIIANALAGRSAPRALARHLGLNKQAAADVGGLLTSSAATSSVVTGTAWVFFILGVSPRPRRSRSCTSGPSSWTAGGPGTRPAG